MNPEDYSHSNLEDPSCLQVCAIDYPPYIWHEKKGRTYGMLVTVLNDVSKYYNFCYNITHPENTPFGIYNEANNTYLGILGLLQRKVCEVILDPMAVNSHRLLFFKSSNYVEYDYLTAMFEYPKLERNILGFLKPFSYEVWIYLVLTMFLVMFFSYLMNGIKWEKYKPTENSRNLNETFLSTFLPIRLLLAQDVPGTYNKFNIFSIHFLTAVWIYFALLMSMSYKCNLKAMLISPNVKIPFTNFEEMVSQTEMGWFLPKGMSFYATHLKDAKAGTLNRKIRDGIEFFSSHIPEVIQKTEQERKAFVIPLQTADYFINSRFQRTGRCTLSRMKAKDYPNTRILYFHKESTYIGKFNQIIRGYQESGIHNYRMGLLMKHAQQCIGNFKLEIQKFGLPDFQGIFYFYFGGLLLSLLVFAVELLVYRINNGIKSTKSASLTSTESKE